MNEADGLAALAKEIFIYIIEQEKEKQNKK